MWYHVYKRELSRPFSPVVSKVVKGSGEVKWCMSHCIGYSIVQTLVVKVENSN